MTAYQPWIGLEIHIHLLTRTKVFCGCRSAFGEEPNTHVCPVCLGYPGVLPALNREALRMSYMVGVALNCTLSRRTVFERKNYFYPDMPKNYQISQYADPIGRNGWFEFETGDGVKRVRIHDIHLEEDAGKMIHAGGQTLLDYNRAGTSLLEIVTEPDFTAGEEAEDFLQAFRRTVRYLGVCDGNMEEGSLRCDANISINIPGHGLGTKVEIKNLNSSRFVRKALNYEYQRQSRLKRSGAVIIQETRLWDEAKQKSVGMRTKEAAHDYRYFPEPDLPPFIPDAAFLAEVQAAAAELPLARKRRLTEAWSLSCELADFLTDEKARADCFEEAVAAGAEPAETAKWMKGEIMKQLSRRGLQLERSPLTPARIARLMQLLAGGTLHAAGGRQVLELILDQDEEPEVIVEREGLTGSDDRAELRAIVDQVISNHPEAADQIREGNSRAIGFLIGQAMKLAGSGPDPKLMRELLQKRLSS